MRICIKIIFHLSKLWKAKFSLLCDVIFQEGLEGKFDIDHSQATGCMRLHSLGHPCSTCCNTIQQFCTQHVAPLWPRHYTCTQLCPFQTRSSDNAIVICYSPLETANHYITKRKHKNVFDIPVCTIASIAHIRSQPFHSWVINVKFLLQPQQKYYITQ